MEQGSAEPVLESRLQPQGLAAAAEAAGQPLTLSLQEGYDHSHFVIANLIDDQLDHHAAVLLA